MSAIPSLHDAFDGARPALPNSLLEDLPLPALRILTCGSVDDGKSTLIGRLLWDATDLADDVRASLVGGGNADGTAVPDFSRLLDGLVAEREQGITIDVAWRYFDTPTRRIVVIDSPGHEQYTRNMASGASHADVAILLVDARHGVKTQTRRHAAILDLMGVKRVILAVNKMDLVGYRESVFREIERQFQPLTRHFGFLEHTAIPLAAVTGENVTRGSAAMPWYGGPTLIECLEAAPGRAADQSAPLRFPVQRVLRDGRDLRGLGGTVAAGEVSVGDSVVDVASGREARVARIVTFDGDLKTARTGQAVVIALDRDLDIARGNVLASPMRAPVSAIEIEARLVWLSDDPFDPRGGYLLRTTTDIATISRLEITAELDLATFASQPASTASSNDIVSASIVLGRAVACEPFTEAPVTGSFLVVDAITGTTVAAGTVAEASAKSRRSGTAGRGPEFRLDRSVLARGLCRDIDDTFEGRAEFARRVEEVALLLKAAGIDAVRDGN